MRSRLPLIIIASLAALAALAVALVAVAGAEDDTDLPPMSAAEVLARMADDDHDTGAISGDVEWTNRLFGELPALGEAAGDALESPLLSDGSGRLWAQDGRARFDAFTRAGDQLLVVDRPAGTVWVYDAVRDTARLYEFEGEPGDAGADGEEEPALGSPAPGSPAPTPPTPERIADMLAAAARTMTVEVSGEAVVAGRDAYLLTMTPTSADTALGTVQAAIDGATFVPLRIDVTARGAVEPVLSFGFERVSYAAVDDDVFAFSPPAGADVVRETIELAASGDDRAKGDEAPDQPARDDVLRAARGALLDREEAAALVDFDLRAAEGYTARPFRWAYVFGEGGPLDAAGAPVFGDLMAAFGGADGETPADAGAEAAGPAAVLLYGDGFGAVALAQTRTTPELREELGELPALFEARPGGAKALLTPLGGAVVWEEGGVTLAAFGIVPGQDLLEFVDAVR